MRSEKNMKRDGDLGLRGSEAPERSDSISGWIERYRESGNIICLAKAGALILREKRICELLHAIPARLLHPPQRMAGEIDSTVGPWLARNAEIILRREIENLYLSRDALMRLFADRFAVDALPRDFPGVRCEGLITDEERGLFAGEYGDRGARIARITRDNCFVNEFYCHDPRVRHIHALQELDGSKVFLVSTGDSRKVLDLWSGSGDVPRYARRLRKRLAGYTAAVRVNGEIYFGTDFSGRPNYIETLSGFKFPFPEPAYRRYVVTLRILENRYIVCLNADVDWTKGVRTLSVFDTAGKSFLYCSYFP